MAKHIVRRTRTRKRRHAEWANGVRTPRIKQRNQIDCLSPDSHGHYPSADCIALPKQRVVVYRMTKAASSSIVLALMNQGGIPVALRMQDGHPTNYTDKWCLKYPRFKNWKKATFVRHPLDRLISGLRWGIAQGWAKVTLEEAIDVALTRLWGQGQQRHGIIPQSDMIYAGKHKIHFVAKVEELPQAYKRMCKWLEIPHKPLGRLKEQLPVIRWQDVIPQNRLQSFVDHFRADFKNFDYPLP